MFFHESSVLSITSATNESSSPKYNLFPILIFRAGSTKTSQRRCSAFNSLSKKNFDSCSCFFLYFRKIAGKLFN
jgi:hypothetical protein